MTDPILLDSERSSLPARPLNLPGQPPPENETVRLILITDEIDGWASRRFLGGRVTYWARIGEQPRCVEPLAWRLLP